MGITDHLANKRTFLAWVRTGIALMGFGFVISKFEIFIHILNRSSYNNIGNSLIAGGDYDNSWHCYHRLWPL